MLAFKDFALSVFKGLAVAIRTDIDVFLMAVAGTLLASKVSRGLGVALLFYLAIRRGDQWMKVYANLKSREIAGVKSNEGNL